MFEIKLSNCGTDKKVTSMLFKTLVVMEPCNLFTKLTFVEHHKMTSVVQMADVKAENLP